MAALTIFWIVVSRSAERILRCLWVFGVTSIVNRGFRFRVGFPFCCSIVVDYHRERTLSSCFSDIMGYGRLRDRST